MSKLALYSLGICTILVLCIMLALRLFGGIQTKNAEILQTRLYNVHNRTYIGDLEIEDIALNYNPADISNYTGYDVWVRFVKREKDDRGNVISDGSCIPSDCKKTKLSMTKDQYQELGCKTRPTVSLILFIVTPSYFAQENGNTVYWNSIAIAITCENGLQPGPSTDKKIATFLLDPTFTMTELKLPNLKVDPIIQAECQFQLWTGAKPLAHKCESGWNLNSMVKPGISSWEQQMRWVDWQAKEPKIPVTRHCIFVTGTDWTMWPVEWGCKDGPDEKLRK